jgi:hypothetical protein
MTGVLKPCHKPGVIGLDANKSPVCQTGLFLQLAMMTSVLLPLHGLHHADVSPHHDYAWHLPAGG